MKIFQRKKNGPPKSDRQNIFFFYTQMLGAATILMAKQPVQDYFLSYAAIQFLAYVTIKILTWHM